MVKGTKDHEDYDEAGADREVPKVKKRTSLLP
jgi:hypothetical protein